MYMRVHTHSTDIYISKMISLICSCSRANQSSIHHFQVKKKKKAQTRFFFFFFRNHISDVKRVVRVWTLDSERFVLRDAAGKKKKKQLSKVMKPLAPNMILIIQLVDEYQHSPGPVILTDGVHATVCPIALGRPAPDEH